MSQDRPASGRAHRVPLRHTMSFAGVLLAFWLALSGRLDAFHVGLGVLSAALIALATQPLLLLPPAIGHAGEAPFRGHPWLALLTFVPWLAVRIAQASAQVVWVVLHPKLPIDPEVIRVRRALPHNLARLTLANSITLTPGTVTLDVEGDEYVIHALTRAQRPRADAPLVERVARMFGAPPA